MDREVGIELWKGLVEALNSVGVAAKKRREFYALLFSVFEDAGFDSFEDLVTGEESIDKALDRAYEGEFG